MVGSSIPDITVNSGVGVALVGGCLEESRTTGSGAAKDQANFSGFQKSGIPEGGSDVNNRTRNRRCRYPNGGEAESEMLSDLGRGL